MKHRAHSSPTAAQREEEQEMNPVLESSGSESVFCHSMARSYIEAYLFSMMIIAYLCIKTVYFNLYWMVYVLLGLLFSSMLQTEDNGLSLLSQNMVWIGHISVSLRFKKPIKKFYKYVCFSSAFYSFEFFLTV